MKPNSWTVLDYIRIGLGGFPQGGLVGIDVTYRCDLNCRHCYFKRQAYRSELSLAQWQAKLEKLKAERAPLDICGWLGGEPLLRPDVLEMGKSYFKSNVIFTNGTRELPEWQDCKFIVSVPGTRRLYSEITGTRNGTYDLVKEHADRPDLDVVVAFCLTRHNADCVEAFIEEWHGRVGVKGVFFEFYTPAKGEGAELWLDWAERDRLLDTLVALKRSYGDFVYNSSQMLRLMKSRRLREILSDCPFSRIGLGLDPMGQRKLPCTLGPDSDCSRCGCILPIFSLLLHRRSLLITAFLGGIVREIRECKHMCEENHAA